MSIPNQEVTQELLAKLKNRAAVMQAYLDGYVIQTNSMIGSSNWEDVGFPTWSWHSRDYRIKTEPMRILMLYRKDGSIPKLFNRDDYTNFDTNVWEEVWVTLEGKECWVRRQS